MVTRPDGAMHMNPLLTLDIGLDLDALRARYPLPGDIAKDVYTVPVSGGVDSSFLALLMTALYPEAPWILFFTDTGEEDPSCYTQLDRVSEATGIPITRLGNETLYGLIEKWGGWIPSPRDRACTRQLKSRPMTAWLKQFEGRRHWMMVGIRSDEKHRLALTLPGVECEMPYIDMGIVRADVFRGLAKTIGIPSLYRSRTRSGCYSCMFQTRSERVGLLQYHPVQFHRAGRVEKLPVADLARQEPAPTITSETGITPNWLSLPQPKEGAELSGSFKSGVETIFGDRGLFVAAEFFEDGMPGYPKFVFHQRVITFSTSLSGLKKQVNRRYEHLLSTAEVHDMTPDEVRTNAKFALYFIEAPQDVLDLAGPGEGAFTWHAEQSYRGLNHIVSWATRVLHAHTIKEEAETLEKWSPVSWNYEMALGSINGLARINAPTGAVAAMGWHTCPEPQDDGETFEEEVSCAMCSI